MPKQVKIKHIRCSRKTQPADISKRSALIEYVRAKHPHLKLKKLGEGAYATVLGSPSGKTVFKIGADDGDGAYNDIQCDAYLNYLKVVCKDQSNPFFPKIKSATVYLRGKEYAYIIEMERLTSLEDGKNHNKLGATERYLFDVLQEDESLEGMAHNVEVMLKLAPELKHNKKVTSLLMMSKKLSKLIQEWGNDMHDGNIMLRGRQLVITDPIA